MLFVIQWIERYHNILFFSAQITGKLVRAEDISTELNDIINETLFPNNRFSNASKNDDEEQSTDDQTTQPDIIPQAKTRYIQMAATSSQSESISSSTDSDMCFGGGGGSCNSVIFRETTV